MKVVLVVAFNNYQDKEYNDTKDILEKAGFEIETVSSSAGEAKGKLGGKVEIKKTIDEISSFDDFDGIVFIGGPGAGEYSNNQNVHQLIKNAAKKSKIVAAICIAPVILAKAGILKDKKATVWNSVFDNSGIDYLKQGGAIYLKQDVVVDGKIITANGPDAAVKFGEAIVKVLQGK